jgi:hypothetical protein
MRAGAPAAGGSIIRLMPSRTWYLFIYQIPPKPLYLRAKIRQRLMRAGAVPLKKSAYAVPAERRLLEPLREIERETEEGGGEAYICEARFVDESTEEELLGKFHEERRRDYEQIVAEARRAPTSNDAVRRLRARLEEVRSIDFFGSPAAKDAAAALEDLETHLGHPGRGGHRPRGQRLARAALHRSAGPLPLRGIGEEAAARRRDLRHAGRRRHP